jgi:hypothetical protein
VVPFPANISYIEVLDVPQFRMNETGLVNLWLGGNYFVGTISGSFLNITSLEELDLEFDYFCSISICIYKFHLTPISLSPLSPLHLLHWSINVQEMQMG